MTKELRRLSIIMLVMFLALFTSTSVIQVFQADQLNAHGQNKRTLYNSFEIQRGSIFAGEVEIASSSPSDDVYSWLRSYEDGEMWAPITGYINPVLGTATALERAMNAELSGTSSSQFLARMERIITGQTPRGSNVLLSMDPAVQKAAYDALGDYEGAIIAMEPQTGRILAMVTSPSYDPNVLAQHDGGAVNEAYNGLANDPLDPLINRTIGGNLNPPASTFKVIVTAAALTSGKYTPDSTFPNPAVYTLTGTNNVLRNYDGGTCGPGKTVTLRDALRLSCNIPFAELAGELGDDAIRETAEAFGYNSSFEIPLETAASVYPLSPNAPQTELSGFGQGDVQATPLQVAMMSQAIANGGMLMQPRMVDAVIAPDLTVEEQFSDAEVRQAISPEVAAQLVTMMTANVQNGAASGARMDGVDVAGKTGTAEHGPGDPYTLWFTGFAPADNPEVAVTVMVENGGGLGQSGTSNGIAAPIAKKVIEAVLTR